jgi:ferric-dicitrate binding protein FerR (iron transport regulator)
MTDREQILQLFGRHADGALTDAESRRLEAALSADRTLRREFLSYLNVDAALGGSMPALSVLKGGQPPRSVRFVPAWIGIAAAALVMLSIGIAWHKQSRPSRSAQPFVTLTAANDAVWADPNVELALRSGELPPGSLRLESGSAEFLCADGATVLMRGPAVVRFPERRRLFVEQGRIFCRCPSPESRLSVETPATEVVDLGTEFAVDARADRSTLVAVLSGEVQVGKAQQRRLHKGEAVEVRGDGILAIQPLAREAFSELLLASPSVSDAVQRGGNLLRDPGFENGLGDQTWNGTDTNVEAIRGGGRSGGAVRVSARGYANWPQCRQKINTGDIAGKLVVASVWAATPARDPLRARQVAMLKIVFVNGEGRDFAFAMRRFVNPKSEPDHFERAQVAAFAPPGTRQVQLQLMLNSNLLDSGSVIFDDASLVIADAPLKN